MKKLLMGMISVLVIVSVMLCSGIFASAQTPAVSVDFESGSFGFIAPGDLNANGSVDAVDLVELKQVLLDTSKKSYPDVYSEIGSKAKYSDINGDNKVTILDLIRAKKTADNTFIGDSVGVNGSKGMNVYGKVALSGSLASSLEADRYYRVSFDYKADAALEIVVDGISDQLYAFESKKTGNWTNEAYLIATAEELSSASGIEVSICGSGVIDNITITPCTVDNDIADTW